MPSGAGAARGGLLAALCVWPLAGLAHIGQGGMEQLPVWITQALFVLVWGLYIGGGAQRRPPLGPRLCFHSAMLVMGVALFGPLDGLAETSAAWHMVQHMLLMVVVAPLLVLARPLPQWRAVLGARVDVLWRTLHRLSRHPMTCALLHAVAIWFWHAPGPYTAALESPLWHVVEHACFLFTGWLFWWSVLGPGRAAALSAAGALLFTVMHTGMLGALLVFARVPLYSVAESALAEQQMAGLVMWVPGGLVYLLAAVWAASRWLGAQEAPSAVPAPHDSTGRQSKGDSRQSSATGGR